MTMASFDDVPMTEKDWKKMEQAVEDSRREHPNSPATIRGLKWKAEQEELERKAGHKLPHH
jgi:hypothetical protein